MFFNSTLALTTLRAYQRRPCHVFRMQSVLSLFDSLLRVDIKIRRYARHHKKLKYELALDCRTVGHRIVNDANDQLPGQTSSSPSRRNEASSQAPTLSTDVDRIVPTRKALGGTRDEGVSRHPIFWGTKGRGLLQSTLPDSPIVTKTSLALKDGKANDLMKAELAEQAKLATELQELQIMLAVSTSSVQRGTRPTRKKRTKPKAKLVAAATSPPPDVTTAASTSLSSTTESGLKPLVAAQSSQLVKLAADLNQATATANAAAVAASRASTGRDAKSESDKVTELLSKLECVNRTAKASDAEISVLKAELEEAHRATEAKAAAARAASEAAERATARVVELETVLSAPSSTLSTATNTISHTESPPVAKSSRPPPRTLTLSRNEGRFGVVLVGPDTIEVGARRVEGAFVYAIGSEDVFDAGLLIGDHILSIDDRDVSDLTLSEVQEVFKSSIDTVRVVVQLALEDSTALLYEQILWEKSNDGIHRTIKVYTSLSATLSFP